jgi:hypothetical protein
MVQPTGGQAGSQYARDWWIQMRGTRHESWVSREAFPLSLTSPSLPARMRLVPDPILALSLCGSSEGAELLGLCTPGRGKNQCINWAWDPEVKGGEEPTHPQSRTWPQKNSDLLGGGGQPTSAAPRDYPTRSWGKTCSLCIKVRPGQHHTYANSQSIYSALVLTHFSLLLGHISESSSAPPNRGGNLALCLSLPMYGLGCQVWSKSPRILGREMVKETFQGEDVQDLGLSWEPN